jgi:CHAT domain-containing protein
VGALIDAGAATVICTLWPADSHSAALIASWFYESLWHDKRSRIDSLRAATERLRTATRDDCEATLGTRIYVRGKHPFEDEYFWGGFVLYGAW